MPPNAKRTGPTLTTGARLSRMPHRGLPTLRTSGEPPRSGSASEPCRLVVGADHRAAARRVCSRTSRCSSSSVVTSSTSDTTHGPHPPGLRVTGPAGPRRRCRRARAPGFRCRCRRWPSPRSPTWPPPSTSPNPPTSSASASTWTCTPTSRPSTPDRIPAPSGSAGPCTPRRCPNGYATSPHPPSPRPPSRKPPAGPVRQTPTVRDATAHRPTEGVQRLRGPARRGKLRCPNVPKSTRAPHTTPLTGCTKNQPCGCGRTVTVHCGDHRRDRQRLPWQSTDGSTPTGAASASSPSTPRSEAITPTSTAATSASSASPRSPPCSPSASPG